MQNAQMNGDQDLVVSLRSQYPDIEHRYGEEFKHHAPYFTASLEAEAIFMLSLIHI